MTDRFSMKPGPGNKGLSIDLSIIEAAISGIGVFGFMGWLVFKNTSDNKNRNEYFLDDFDDSII